MEKRKRPAVHEAGKGEEKSQRKPRPQKTMPDMDLPGILLLSCCRSSGLRNVSECIIISAVRFPQGEGKILFPGQAARRASFVPENMISSVGSRMKTVEMYRAPGFTVPLGNLLALE